MILRGTTWLLVRLACLVAYGAKLPNILWITSEDNAAHWLGCYGNEQASTPRLDALAADATLFLHAYSNAPVCAVARSTILNGAYAVSMGTQHMRSRHPVPQQFRPYVEYLREQGYYCTNNRKTDYNQQGDDRSIRDASSGKAHYRNRPEGCAFFAVFNLTVCHESSLFPEKVAQHRKNGLIPEVPSRDPAGISVPPYLPDLPEVRADLAIYYDTLTAMDRQVGELLDELAELGLEEETIVFYYADHGGPTPRGKRYLKDTGVKIPMIVRVPPAWSAMTTFSAGARVEEIVAFVDLAPTVLSLAGVATPPQMQGRAFLGPHRKAPPTRPLAFLYADRFDELIGMRRGITDGRYKYIRRFMPHLPAAPYSFYQFSMPSWIAWRDAWTAGRLAGRHREIWETPQPVEELFDTSSDPWEVNNLAGHPDHQKRLATMRRRLRQTMDDVRDTGVIPEALFHRLAGDESIHGYAAAHPNAMQAATELAFLASAGDPEHLAALLAALDEEDPVLRFWGAMGCVVLGEAATPAAARLKRQLDDPMPAVRIAVGRALHGAGDLGAARAALLGEFQRELQAEEGVLLINTLIQIDAADQVPEAWIERNAGDPDANEYLQRLAKRLQRRP